MAFGLCAGDTRFHDCPVGLVQGSWGWWSDGSLRAHGKVLTQAEVSQSPGGGGRAQVTRDRSCCHTMVLHFLYAWVVNWLYWLLLRAARCLTPPTTCLLFCQPQHCGDGSREAVADVLYGLEFLPLKPCDVITMVTDTFRGTVCYLVNGVDAGVAFGPPESGAVYTLTTREAPFTWNGGAVLFPSCSLTNDKQVRHLVH